MKLKLDENLGRGPAEQLSAGGHDVRTVVDQDMCASSDRELVAHCRSEGRALVTLDLGFGNPLEYQPSRYPGIAVLRLPARSRAEDLHDTVDSLVRALESLDLTGQLWIVQAGRVRVYEEPGPEGA